MSSSDRDRNTGVRWACGAIRAAAESTAAKSGNIGTAAVIPSS